MNGQSGCWDRVRSGVSRVGSAGGRIAVNGAERRTVRQVAKRGGAIASVKRKSVGCRGADCCIWGAKGALVGSRDLWSWAAGSWGFGDAGSRGIGDEGLVRTEWRRQEVVTGFCTKRSCPEGPVVTEGTWDGKSPHLRHSAQQMSLPRSTFLFLFVDPGRGRGPTARVTLTPPAHPLCCACGPALGPVPHDLCQLFVFLL